MEGLEGFGVQGSGFSSFPAFPSTPQGPRTPVPQSPGPVVVVVVALACKSLLGPGSVGELGSPGVESGLPKQVAGGRNRSFLGESHLGLGPTEPFGDIPPPHFAKHFLCLSGAARESGPKL